MAVARSSAGDASHCHDVIIVGAGLSGIGAACHLRRECPDRDLRILESRACSGGTWDLFRYPGVRSDSDMHTLGYDFRPWTGAKAIAEGEAILRYIRDTAAEQAVEPLIRYRQAVERADWDSATQYWTLTVHDGETGEKVSYRARFLLLCAGYYRYDHGYQPAFPGIEDFSGDFVHPQHWPATLDYRGKRVLVIGSGATAMTLVPAMAADAAEVVLLQRSPSYVIARSSKDRLAGALGRILSSRWAYAVARWKNTRLQYWFFRWARRAPEQVRRYLLRGVEKALGNSSLGDFTPGYNPWEQRLCVVPDGDLFEALRGGAARMVTGRIERITAGGVRLTDGRHLATDILVSATGLELQLMGGIDIRVDGAPFDFPASWSYRGIMCSGLPNLVAVFGYVNASWTLRADLVSRWCCRLLNHMRDGGYASVTPELQPVDRDMTARPWIEDFSAGYLQRVMHRLPRQGDRPPWTNCQDYFRERRAFQHMALDEAQLCYRTPGDAADAAARG
jgi:monooxygenase